MSVSLFFKLYAVAFVTFMAIDLVWLGIVARGFYRNELGHLMRPDVNWIAAVLFYVIFVAGIVILAVWPAIERQSLVHAVVLGAVFGLVTYAAYDLTNLATLEAFPVRMVVVDMIWGTVLCTAISTVTYLASTRIG